MLKLRGHEVSAGEKLQTVLRLDMGGLTHRGTLADGEAKRVGTDAPYEMPVTMICGAKPGKTVLITTCIHSGEYPGIPAVIRAARNIEPNKLQGNVILFHCVNTSGFWAKSHTEVPEDGFNLNSGYPGNADGGVGARIAAWFVREIFPQVDFIMDFHSGSPYEIMTPLLFYPTAPAVTRESLAAAKALNMPYLLASTAQSGEYSYAANHMNIPGLLLELGYGGLCKDEWVQTYYDRIFLLLEHLEMYKAATDISAPKPKRIYKRTIYQTSEHDGLWYPQIRREQALKKGDLLGYVEEFFGNRIAEYRAKEDGVVFYYTTRLAITKGDPLIAYGTADSMETVE